MDSRFTARGRRGNTGEKLSSTVSAYDTDQARTLTQVLGVGLRKLGLKIKWNQAIKVT